MVRAGSIHACKTWMGSVDLRTFFLPMVKQAGELQVSAVADAGFQGLDPPPPPLEPEYEYNSCIISV